jgi:hypothetical protein
MRGRLVPFLLSLALVVGLAACGDDDDGGARTEEPIELTRSGGCGDAYLWAATEDGTVAVTVAVEVPRHSTRDDTVVEVDLPDPDVEAHLLRGDRDLTRNFCTDALDGNAEPTSTVPLTAGTGEVVTTPVPTDVDLCGEVEGSLELVGVEAEDGTRVADIAASTEAIGCDAG